MCPLFHIENIINEGDLVQRRETGGMWDKGGKVSNVLCIFILVFYFIFLSFVWFLCGDRRVAAPGEEWGSAGEGKRFLIARCPSFTTHTTSTRPVFGNLYC